MKATAIVRLSFFDNISKIPENTDEYNALHDKMVKMYTLLIGDALENVEILPLDHHTFCSRCGATVNVYADEDNKLCELCKRIEMIKEDKEDLKTLSDIEKWAKEVQKNCKHIVEPKMSIPSMRATCDLTGDVCDYYSCPLRKMEEAK